MANDADQARLERHGRAIQSAYRSARLTPAQHDRHRTRLAERYTESPRRSMGTAGVLAAAGLMVVLVVAAFAVWSGLSPESDDGHNEAIFTALPTNTVPPGETTVPSITATPPVPTPSPTTVDTGVGSDPAIDHERLYVVDESGQVRGRDLETGEELFQIRAGYGVDAALSPDDTRLYLADGDSLTAHDALTGEELWRTPIEHRRFWHYPEYGPLNIAVSSDGRRIFVVSIERPNLPWVQIFDASDGSKIGDSDTVYGNCPANLHTSPDGRTLYLVCVSTGDDEGIKIVDLDTGESSDLLEGQFASSAASPDGRLLYAVTTSQRLMTIDMDSREVVSDFALDLPAPPEKYLQMAAVSPDGSRLHIGLGRDSSDDGRPRLWEDVREIATIDLTDGATLEVSELDFLIDAKGLEIDGDGNLYVYSGGQIMRLAGGEAEPLRYFVEMDVFQFLLASPSSTITEADAGSDPAAVHERLYAVDQYGQVQGRDLETGEELFQIDGGSDVDAALSPDGSRLYLVNHESLIALDALTGEELWRAPVEDRISWISGIGPSTVAVSQDGEWLFVYSSFAPERQWMQVFDAGDGSKIGDTETLTGNCPAEMHSSPDGETLYLVCIRFGSMRIIDLNTGENTRSMAGQGSGSTITPDGQSLYVVTTSKRLITIDMDSREIVDDTYLDLPASPTLLREMVAISPDGTRLYIGLGRENNDGDTGSQDVREIAIIDLADASTVEVIETHLQFDGKGLAVDRNGGIYANTGSAIVRLVPGAPDPALVTEGQVIVSGNGTEIRQFLLASPVE